MSSAIGTPEITDTEVADVIEKALTLMNEKGAHWIKGDYRSECGTKFCSVGGLRAAIGLYDDAYDALTYLQQLRRGQILDQASYAIAKKIDPDYSGTLYNASAFVIGWNDKESRTWNDVVGAFMGAAATLRGAPQ
jgi:hypothetical protein